MLKDWLKRHILAHKENNYSPRLFAGDVVATFATLSALLFLGALFYTSVVSTSNFLASVLPSVLVDLTNDNRSIYDIRPVVHNALLERSAQTKADDMARRGYFSHNTPDGLTPWYWFDQAGYPFIYAGENLAIQFNDSREVVRAWMNSPTHRENILNGNFDEVGIAVADGIYQGRPTTFVVQHFGRPLLAAAPAPTETAPRPVTPPTGAVIPTPVEPVLEDDTLIVVRNASVSEAAEEAQPDFIATLGLSTADDTDTGTDDPGTSIKDKEELEGVVSGIAGYSSRIEKFFSSPGKILQSTYGVLALLIFIAIFISLFYEFKHHKGRHLVGAIFLLALLAFFYYLYQHFVAAGVVL